MPAGCSDSEGSFEMDWSFGLDGAFNTRTGKGLRIMRPGKGGGGQILPLPAISASIRVYNHYIISLYYIIIYNHSIITKLGKRKDMLVNFMVCNFGDLGSIF